MSEEKIKEFILEQVITPKESYDVVRDEGEEPLFISNGLFNYRSFIAAVEYGIALGQKGYTGASLTMDYYPKNPISKKYLVGKRTGIVLMLRRLHMGFKNSAWCVNGKPETDVNGNPVRY